MYDTIDMNNRRQYQYSPGLKPYRVETISVADGDVIILHLAKDIDFAELNTIRADIQKMFPNNTILCANENILESISVIKKEKNPFVEFDLEDLL